MSSIKTFTPSHTHQVNPASESKKFSRIHNDTHLRLSAFRFHNEDLRYGPDGEKQWFTKNNKQNTNQAAGMSSISNYPPPTYLTVKRWSVRVYAFYLNDLSLKVIKFNHWLNKRKTMNKTNCGMRSLKHFLERTRSSWNLFALTAAG